jgi:integron integrase
VSSHSKSRASGASPFLERVRSAIRVRHYSIRTEQAYLDWIRRFVRFHGLRHPEQMGEAEVAAFLSDLAVVRKVAPSTQNQALNALLFLYTAVLERPLAAIGGVVRAKPRERLPVVLTVDEIGRLLAGLPSRIWLVGCLQYGSGLRLLESVRLRVKDLDFGHRAILVRDGKGGRDRVVTLPDELVVPLERHLVERRTLVERDLAAGCGGVYLPYALANKYPRAPLEWGWQYVFPAERLSEDPRGEGRRQRCPHSTPTTIFPHCPFDSMCRCASTTSSSANTRSISGRYLPAARPAATAALPRAYSSGKLMTSNSEYPRRVSPLASPSATGNSDGSPPRRP